MCEIDEGLTQLRVYGAIQCIDCGDTINRSQQQFIDFISTDGLISYKHVKCTPLERIEFPPGWGGVRERHICPACNIYLDRFTDQFVEVYWNSELRPMHYKCALCYYPEGYEKHLVPQHAA